MQYMLLIYGSEDAWESYGEDERNAMYAEYGKLSRDLREQNALRRRRRARAELHGHHGPRARRRAADQRRPVRRDQGGARRLRARRAGDRLARGGAPLRRTARVPAHACRRAEPCGDDRDGRRPRGPARGHRLDRGPQSLSPAPFPRADLLRRLGRRATAREAYEQALALRPGTWSSISCAGGSQSSERTAAADNRAARPSRLGKNGKHAGAPGSGRDADRRRWLRGRLRGPAARPRRGDDRQPRELHALHADPPGGGVRHARAAAVVVPLRRCARMRSCCSGGHGAERRGRSIVESSDGPASHRALRAPRPCAGLGVARAARARAGRARDSASSPAEAIALRNHVLRQLESADEAPTTTHGRGS